MLPKTETKSWEKELSFFKKSTKDQRRKRAKELGYKNEACYREMMNRRGVYQDKPKVPEIKFESEQPPKMSFHEHIAVLQGMDRLLAYHVKTPDVVDIYIETDLPIAITEWADLHLGQFGCDYQSFERDTATIETEPGLLVNMGGDAIHNIIQASKIGSSHNQAPIAVQKGLYALTLQKLARKILTIKSGNHLDWDVALSGEDWIGERARQMKAVYIKNGGRINYHIGKQTYTEFSLHKGKFNSSFNLTHTCKQYQRMHCPEARIITVEHQHTAAMEQYRYNGKECVAIRGGTYSMFDDFARANGFYGQHVANPTVILFPDRDRLIGFKDMYDAIDMLRAVRN